MEVGDRVRLVSPLGDIPAGSEGVVFGFYRHPEHPAVAVTFGAQARSVPADLLELVEPITRGHRRAG